MKGCTVLRGPFPLEDQSRLACRGKKRCTCLFLASERRPCGCSKLRQICGFWSICFTVLYQKTWLRASRNFHQPGGYQTVYLLSLSVMLVTQACAITWDASLYTGVSGPGHLLSILLNWINDAVVKFPCRKLRQGPAPVSSGQIFKDPC